jgi:hypothetical protein
MRVVSVVHPYRKCGPRRSAVFRKDDCTQRVRPDPKLIAATPPTLIARGLLSEGCAACHPFKEHAGVASLCDGDGCRSAIEPA